MLLPLHSAPQLAPSAVHVWAIHLDDNAWEDLQSLLSADELSRAARFHFERDRRRFTVARAALSQILAAYTGVDATQLVFSYSPYGKPSLKHAPGDVRFNVSHSDSLAAIAITSAREIGVDIEKVRDDIEIEQLANRFFSPAEVATFSVLRDQKSAAFFRIWTCKEAFLKGQGMGLALPLDCFDVQADIAKPAALLATRPDPAEAAQWSLRLLPIARAFAAAVAVRGPVAELSIFRPNHSSVPDIDEG